MNSFFEFTCKFFVIFNTFLIEQNVIKKESDNIVENDKNTENYEDMISSLPSGNLNFYESAFELPLYDQKNIRCIFKRFNQQSWFIE